jgi:ABC-type multidrug transport system fused ATPase/permease subunit
LTGLPVIKSMHLERWTKSVYEGLTRDHLTANITLMNWNSVVRPLTVMFCLVPTIMVVMLGGHRVLDGGMTLGIFVVFVRYSERFLAPVRTISQEIHQIQDALSSSERIRLLLLENEESSELGKDGTHAGTIAGEIEYRNVQMSYRGTKPVLNDISFCAKPGMKVALVGETGSGKTSTLSLIPRLYRFGGGSITIDGVPIADWQRSALRGQLGLVSQDVIVFRGTLRENLVAAHQDPAKCNDEMIMVAAEQTGLAKIIESLPAGLDSFVHHGGSNLSMGERQLIAFTRMLIRDPAVLILDEATANLDEGFEKVVQRAINVVMKGRTCFIIAHRLSTVMQSDVILVFRDGKIVERGSHVELMELAGYYSELVSRQGASIGGKVP